jgi:hypothetical protein
MEHKPLGAWSIRGSPRFAVTIATASAFLATMIRKRPWCGTWVQYVQISVGQLTADAARECAGLAHGCFPRGFGGAGSGPLGASAAARSSTGFSGRLGDWWWAVLASNR